MKVSITKIKLALLAMLFALTAKAQIDTTGLNTHSWRCGNDSTMFSSILGTRIMDAMVSYDDSILARTTSTATVTPFIVPVVFHIITPSSYSATITYQQIKW